MDKQFDNNLVLFDEYIPAQNGHARGLLWVFSMPKLWLATPPGRPKKVGTKIQHKSALRVGCTRSTRRASNRYETSPGQPPIITLRHLTLSHQKSQLSCRRSRTLSHRMLWHSPRGCWWCLLRVPPAGLQTLLAKMVYKKLKIDSLEKEMKHELNACDVICNLTCTLEEGHQQIKITEKQKAKDIYWPKCQWPSWTGVYSISQWHSLYFRMIKCKENKKFFVTGRLLHSYA